MMIDVCCPYCRHRQQFFNGGFVAPCAMCGQAFTVPVEQPEPPSPRRRSRSHRYDEPSSQTSGLAETISIMSAFAAGGIILISLVIPVIVAVFFAVLACLLSVVSLIAAGCSRSSLGGAIGVILALIVGGISIVATLMIVSQLSSATRHF
jgi:hypothetical protein